jgi:hypothetical protein
MARRAQRRFAPQLVPRRGAKLGMFAAQRRKVDGPEGAVMAERRHAGE